MADNTVNLTIQVLGNAPVVIQQLNVQFDQLKKTAEETAKKTESLFDKIGNFAFKLNNIVGAISNVTNKMREFTDASKLQQEAESKLAQVMNNTMGASMEEIDSIKQLASVQQQLGVIGDEVQLAGAQELGTYLTKSETLKKLMPVMNDMVAQQYGLNASQESAVGIATMMGKVMDGQVGALSRYGYKFDEAQEKILKFGTEEERAAVLADVISNSVGGVNEALANTPEGKVQQAAMSFGDLKEYIGQVYVKLQAALVPAVNTAINAFYGLMDFFQNFWPIIVGITGAIAALTIAVNAHAIATKIVGAATKMWAGVQAVLNAVMTANPIGLIIAGIIVLVGVIVFLCLKIKGWGTLWDAVVTFAKETFYAYVDGVKLYFTTMVNAIMMGIDKIKEGWYKFKIAVGIGDEDENLAALKKVQSDIKERAEKIAGAAKVEKEHLEKARHAFDKVSLQWDKSVTLKSTTDKLKAELGMSGEVNETNNNATVNNDLSDASTKISSGGKNIKNFNITINDGLVNGVQNYFNSSNDNPESASDFMWRLSNALQMILNDVNYAAQ
jgi:hypothetical protein